MGGSLDPYWRLRPESATPPDELCNCTDSPPIIVQDHLSPVPLACIRCNRKVPPERIGFSESLAENLAFWRTLYRALELLWLDSGEYEDWARARLEDPVGRLNVQGLAITAELNVQYPAYYRWFEETSRDDF